MAIRTILVPLTNRGASGGAMDCAFLLGREAGAHVEGIYAPTDVIELLPPEYRGRLGAYERVKSDVKRDIEAQGRVLRQRFDVLAKAAGADIRHTPALGEGPSASWKVVRDSAADAVRRLGGAYDLIAVDLPNPATAENEDQAIVEAALVSTGRAVLVCPAVPPKSLGRVVLVGWNRTPQAARAVERAVPILQRAERVVVLSVTTGAKLGPTAAEIARYLAWHGIAAEIQEVSPDQRAVGESLLAQARRIQADLLVMGAYSHGGVRRLILGGVTHYVLAHATLPVLLAQ